MTTEKRVTRVSVVAAAAVGAVCLLAPSIAAGSAVSIAGKTLKVTDPANVAQNQSVSYDAATATFAVTDGGGPMTAVAPCLSNAGATAVQCPGAGVTGIQVLGNGGIDDIVIQPSVPTGIRTALSGGAGPDVLTGGGGGDLLDGGDGADTVIGGLGIDSATYSSRPGPAGVFVRIGAGPISGNGADGPVGARDRIANDVEGVIGTEQNDGLRGNGSANRLKGAGGLDKIGGGAGRDTLLGGARRDILKGGDGGDKIIGGTGDDVLVGQDGLDKLFAADGAADGIIDCGAPAAPEFAAVDGLDPATVDC